MSTQTERWRQGQFTPLNPQKYRGANRVAIYRSSWEYKCFIYCDQSPKILHWGSERIAVPYYSPIDNQMHRYFVDLDLECMGSDGKLKKFIVEIKPEEQAHKPKAPKRLTEKSQRNFLMKQMTYVINMAKWNAAAEWAKRNGYEFFVLTEKTANFLFK